MKMFEMELFWLMISPTYYWLMYALAFMFWYMIIKKSAVINKVHLDDLFFYMFLWVILWWSFGYMLFYNLSSYLTNPLDMLKVWEWWMSFHGWVIWVMLAMYLFASKFKYKFLNIADQVTLILPMWLWLWSIWNYLNKELLWFSDYNWMFAVYKQGMWYFPSPLLEAFLEWFVLYFMLYYFYSKNIKPWQVAALFLVFYGLFSLMVELFFSMPDSHMWYLFSNMSMWSMLSFPMMMIWLMLYFSFKK